MARGNLAIDTIFVMTVSIIAIFFLLFVFSGKLPAVGKEVYCKTFFHLATSKYFPEPVRQSQDYCVNEISNKAILIQANFKDYTRSVLSDGSTTARLGAGGIIKVNLPEDARVTFSNLTFLAKQPLANVDIDVGSDLFIEDTLANPPVNTRFSFTDNKISSELTNRVNSSAKPCLYGECEIPISVTADNNITLTDMDIEYKSCAIVDTIIAQMQLCDDKSGASATNIVCGEVAISNDCQPVSIDKPQLADRLVKENLCEQLPIETYGCGSGDKVDWTLTQLDPGQNILIEYRASTKTIAVS